MRRSAHRHAQTQLETPLVRLVLKNAVCNNDLDLSSDWTMKNTCATATKDRSENRSFYPLRALTCGHTENAQRIDTASAEDQVAAIGEIRSKLDREGAEVSEKGSRRTRAQCAHMYRSLYWPWKESTCTENIYLYPHTYVHGLPQTDGNVLWARRPPPARGNRGITCAVVLAQRAA